MLVYCQAREGIITEPLPPICLAATLPVCAYPSLPPVFTCIHYNRAFFNKKLIVMCTVLFVIFIKVIMMTKTIVMKEMFPFIKTR